MVLFNILVDDLRILFFGWALCLTCRTVNTKRTTKSLTCIRALLKFETIRIIRIRLRESMILSCVFGDVLLRRLLSGICGVCCCIDRSVCCICYICCICCICSICIVCRLINICCCNSERIIFNLIRYSIIFGFNPNFVLIFKAFHSRYFTTRFRNNIQAKCLNPII